MTRSWDGIGHGKGRWPILYYATLEHSYVLQVVQGRAVRARALEWMHARKGLAQSAGLGEVGLDGGRVHGARDATWKEAWAVTDDLLRTMNREVREKGAKFIVVTLSNGDEVNPDIARRHALEKQLNVLTCSILSGGSRRWGSRRAFPC